MPTYIVSVDRTLTFRVEADDEEKAYDCYMNHDPDEVEEVDEETMDIRIEEEKDIER